MIAHSTIERIKAIPVKEVIGKYLDLKPAGSTFRAKSPFADEKTPSFYVVPAKNIFKCFSSGKGGSAITFVMEHTGLPYPDAIVEIANKFGERVEYEESAMATEAQAEREDLYKINQAAARKYQEQLVKEMVVKPENESHYHNEASPLYKELIVKRMFTPDTITQWQIGYAPLTGEVNGYSPDAWKFLTNILHEVAKIEPALKLGLVKQKDKVTYDTFHNRIMYPIHDQHGRIAGFGGGWLGEKDEYNPKYLNASESVLFNKKAILFGLHFADDAIRKHGYALLVEGYTDVISLHQADFNMTVGTCGTALTDEQCKLLKNYCSKVVIVPDSDEPGLKAAMRSIPMLMKHGFNVAIVMMPEFEDKRKIDPDDLVRLFAGMEKVEPPTLTVKSIDAAEKLANVVKSKMMELDENDPELKKLDKKKAAPKKKKS